MKNSIWKQAISAFVVLLLLGCGTTISQFDQYAYTQTTSIKVDALHLVDKGTDDYNLHSPEITNLITQIEKAYEYEKNRPKNIITTKMWEEIKNPNGKLLGGFLTFWKTQNEKGKKLNVKFVEDEHQLLDSAFDKIAQLESKKIKN